MKDKIKAILFDVDDTLFDRNKAQPMVLDRIISCFPQLFASLDKARVLKAFMDSDRISTEEWDLGAHSDDIRDYRSNLFLKALDIGENYVTAMTEAYVSEYPNVNAPVDGALDLVNNASRRFKTGIISNSLPDVQYRKLETLGIRHIFNCIVLSEELGVRKPDPEIFLHAADKLHVQAFSCLYIGNSYTHDIIGAKNAGMITCWFRYDRSNIDNADRYADYVVDKLEEAGKIISRL